MTVTTTEGAFRGLLADLLHTVREPDTGVPQIECIRLYTAQAGGETVLAGCSTDRVVLGMCHVQAVKGNVLPPLLMPQSCVKYLLPRLAEGTDRLLTITNCIDGLVQIECGWEYSFLPSTAPWPENINDLFMDAAPEPGAAIMLDPALLARFTAIAEQRRARLRVVPSAPHKPVNVFIGESYRGLIMPLRGDVRGDDTRCPVLSHEQPVEAVAQ